MASGEPETVVETAAPAEVEKAPVELPPEVKYTANSPPIDYFALAEVVLRFLLFASALVAVVVIVTSEQTKPPSLPVHAQLDHSLTPAPAAYFDDSPAFIYFVAALSVAGLYSIITAVLSLYALLVPGSAPPEVLSLFVVFDVLLLGIVAAATGAAGAVAYIDLNGNPELGWGKVCDVYDIFCGHIGASVAVSLFASIVLALLVLLSIYSPNKNPKANC